jgi:hypothetical protein
VVQTLLETIEAKRAHGPEDDHKMLDFAFKVSSYFFCHRYNRTNSSSSRPWLGLIAVLSPTISC